MKISLEPQQALAVINEAKNLAVVTASPVTLDAVSALLAFYHTFKKFKKLRLVVPESVPEGCHDLPESSVIEKDLGPKKLSINLDTNGVPLEKVTYLQEGRRFKLIVHPERRSFDVERVSFEYLGFPFDSLVFFGVKSLNEIASLFGYDLSEISRYPLLNFDVSESNELYGSVNLVDPSCSSICEMFFKVLGYWQVNFDRSVSHCLLNGLLNSPDRHSQSLAGSFGDESSTIKGDHLLGPKTASPSSAALLDSKV